MLEQAVDMICRADSVLLFGLGASQLVAKDAYLKFLRIDKPCSCCEDIHSVRHRPEFQTKRRGDCHQLFG